MYRRPGGRGGRRPGMTLAILIHSCHILPFQPILWNEYFPPEPAKTAKHSPKSISEGVEYGKYVIATNSSH